MSTPEFGAKQAPKDLRLPPADDSLPAPPSGIVFDYPMSGRGKMFDGIALMIWGIVVMIILFGNFN